MSTPLRARLLLGLLAVVPVVPAIIVLLGDLSAPGRYFPYGDNAIIELQVRGVGHESVLLGPYSRFGWNHPGPLLYYVLVLPYRLLGSSSAAIAIGTLLLAGASLVTIALLVRRHAGTAAALWTLLVLAVMVRLLEPGFLRDPWNPELPLLPFAAVVFLCWAATQGDRWALPVAALPASLAVQSHVGYLVGVAFVVVLGALGLLSARWAEPKRLLRWLAVLGLATVVLVLLWLPAIIEQLTHSPGNLRVLADYLRHASSDSSLRTGLRSVADELAKLPAYATGRPAPTAVLLPLDRPLWAAGVAVVAFLAAAAVALRWRSRPLLWLGAMAIALAVAGVLAVAQISGLTFPYVTQWTTVVGVVWWAFIGATAIEAVRRSLAGRAPAQPARPALAALAALGVLPVLAAVVVLGVGTAREHTPQTDTSGRLYRLERAVVADVAQQPGGRSQPVRLDFAGTSRPVIVGTSFPGSGIGLALIKDGVDVRTSPFWAALLGQRRTRGADQVRYVATLAYSDGSSPPPAPGQRVLRVEGEYEIYGGLVAAG